MTDGGKLTAAIYSLDRKCSKSDVRRLSRCYTDYTYRDDTVDGMADHTAVCSNPVAGVHEVHLQEYGIV